MARPSQNIDQALLNSGRALFPQCGCKDLSLRQLTEHANCNMGMFHYHFRSKDNFLATLLQNMYEELFAQLQAETEHPGTPIERLAHTMILLARLLREHGHWLGRVWSDAAHGESVAQEFLKKNGSRHMQLLISLIMQAKLDGSLGEIAPMQAFTFLMGSIAAPMVIAPRVMQLGFAPQFFHQQMQDTVLSDEAIVERVQRALYALQIPKPSLASGEPHV